jgi:hypothetical protein
LTDLVTKRTVPGFTGREELVMKNLLRLSVGLSGVAALVLSSVALGSSGGKQAVAGRSTIAIRATVSANQSTDGRFRGRFVILLDSVIQDSGTIVVIPDVGIPKVIDGQPQAPVLAYGNLRSKKGTLNIFFTGVNVLVQDLNPAKDGFNTESGTWKIKSATGKYKGWTGGGRWTNVSPPDAQHIEWDGYVKH